MTTLASLHLNADSFAKFLASRSYSEKSQELLTGYFVLGYQVSDLAVSFAVPTRQIHSLIGAFRDAVLLSRVPAEFDFAGVPDSIFDRAGRSRRLTPRSIRLADLVLRGGYVLSRAQVAVGMRARPVTRGFLVTRTMKAAILEQLEQASA